MKPRSINIFLLDGDSNGIRVAQIWMSTIQAIAFRRSHLKRGCNAFPEFERPGVNVLIGGDENEPHRQLACIGKSEGVGARLRENADVLIFTSDYSFPSASAAAALVIGASANGRIL